MLSLFWVLLKANKNKVYILTSVIELKGNVPANSNNNTAPEPFDLTESHNCKYQPYRIKLQLIVKLSTLRTPLIKTQHRGQEAQTPKYQGSTSKLKHLPASTTVPKTLFLTLNTSSSTAVCLEKWETG